MTGELDIASAPLSRRLLAVAAEHPERLVLDLSALVFVDVAGARTLDRVHTLLRTECPVNLRPRLSMSAVGAISEHELMEVALVMLTQERRSFTSAYEIAPVAEPVRGW